MEGGAQQAEKTPQPEFIHAVLAYGRDFRACAVANHKKQTGSGLGSYSTMVAFCTKFQYDGSRASHLPENNPPAFLTARF